MLSVTISQRELVFLLSCQKPLSISTHSHKPLRVCIFHLLCGVKLQRYFDLFTLCLLAYWTLSLKALALSLFFSAPVFVSQTYKILFNSINTYIFLKTMDFFKYAYLKQPGCYFIVTWAWKTLSQATPE